MPSPERSCHSVINDREIRAQKLLNALRDEPGRNGCVVWLAEEYFPDVGPIRKNLRKLYGDALFVPGLDRYLLVPAWTDDPVNGMAEKVVRKDDKVSFVRAAPPRSRDGRRAPPWSPPVDEEPPKKADRIAHVGWSRVFRPDAQGKSRAEEIFGSAWERVAFIGWCQPAGAPLDPLLPSRVTVWENSRAYLWLNVPQREKTTGPMNREKFVVLAQDICRQLGCDPAKAGTFHVSGMLRIDVPTAWDAYQFTCEVMALQMDNKGVVFSEDKPLYRNGKSPYDDGGNPRTWAVLNMSVDRLCEPAGRIPLEVRNNGLQGPDGNLLARYDSRLDSFLSEAYERINAPRAWRIAEEKGADLARVSVCVIDGAVWEAHRDLRASNPTTEDFCTHPEWNMPPPEHARHNAHGTICAGLIGAKPAEGHEGLRGIAPGVQLRFARAFGARRRESRPNPGRPDGYWLLFYDEVDDTDFNHNDVRDLGAEPGSIAKAVYWAAFEARCDVILMSFEAREDSAVENKDVDFSKLPRESKEWGTPGVLAAVLAAAAERGGKRLGKDGEGEDVFRGCVLVAAAGNRNKNAQPGDKMVLPAAHPAVMRVGATSAPRTLSTGWILNSSSKAVEETRAVVSKFLDPAANLALDIVAPGLGLVSTSHPFLLRERDRDRSDQQFYTFGAATSDAAPLVAGAAALLLALGDALGKSLLAKDVRKILRRTARGPVDIIRRPGLPQPKTAPGFPRPNPRPGLPMPEPAPDGEFLGELDVAAACEAVVRHPAS